MKKSPVKILVVDDEAVNRALVVTLIQHRGYQALEASDGAEALAMARAQTPALVISDILMPTMDGFEFVRQLRADPATAPTEVIFYTAHYREREARNLAESCGVSRVLAKPCEPQDILDAIDQSLAALSRPVQMPDAPAFDREHIRLMTDKLSQQVATLERTNQRLEALTQHNLYFASEGDPSILLDKFCHSARELLGAKFAVLYANGKPGTSPLFATSGIEAEVVQKMVHPAMDAGVPGMVRRGRCAKRLAAAGHDPLELGFPPGYPPLRTALVVPVVSLTRDYGWICLGDKLGAQEFSAEDEQVLSILAALVGRIYENDSLYRELQEHAELLQLESEERRRAVESLRLSEAGLYRAQVLARLSHVITGPAGEFASWSETLPALVGIKPSEMVKSTREWIEMIHPEDRALFRAKAIQAGAGGVRTDLEYRLRRADGSWRDVRQIMEPVRPGAASGTPTWSFHTIQDVSAQKENERALRETSLQLKALSARVLEAQETERRRVARELHDELGQSLTAIKINLQLRERFGDRSPDELAEENIRIVDDALKHVRGLAMALRPSVLDDLGLAPALQWIADQTIARSGLRIQVFSDLESTRLAPELETACFRIVQESLTNVMRHARASAVAIRLQKAGDDLSLSVQDDGVGFDPVALRGRAVAGLSMGMLGMQERATLIGGRLEIHASTGTGTGTTIVMRCPLRVRE